MTSSSDLLNQALDFDTQAEGADEKIRELRQKMNALLEQTPDDADLAATSNILAGHEKTLMTHATAA